MVPQVERGRMSGWRATEYAFTLFSVQQVPRAFYRAFRTSRRHHWNATNLWVIKRVARVELIKGVTGFHLGPEACYILSFLCLPESFPKAVKDTRSVRTRWHDGISSGCCFMLYDIPRANHPGPVLLLEATVSGVRGTWVQLRCWSCPCWKATRGFAA